MLLINKILNTICITKENKSFLWLFHCKNECMAGRYDAYYIVSLHVHQNHTTRFLLISGGGSGRGGGTSRSSPFRKSHTSTCLATTNRATQSQEITCLPCPVARCVNYELNNACTQLIVSRIFDKHLLSPHIFL